jgi:hypothetical protein
MDLSGYEWTLINLSEKIYAKPAVKCDEAKSVIQMHHFISDVLILGLKNL